MAQDVSKKMAEEPWVLNEDGYLNASTDIKEIVYHPTLNIILLCSKSGVVRVLDVNTGVVLQSSNLSAINQNEVTCRYIPVQDRILFTDGQAIGVRSEYNGVLLLDSILQKIVADPNEEVVVELPIAEVAILKQSLLSSGQTGVENVLKELTNAISDSQQCDRKGIKAQKWNIVSLKLPLNELRSATTSIVTNILAKNLQTSELPVASALQERMSELLGEVANASDRRAMASESKRRDTFSQWPHMDYKWALPEQMAQAGFYHQPNQPNAPGEDRALCFTCSVCLVCWEKTDEPWSEHERHSQNCAFMMGEYTHNVPVSVTHATNPAIDATYRGMNLKVLGTSSVPHLIPASNDDGLISIFDISGKITRPYSFYVSQYDSFVLDKITQEFTALANVYGSNSYPTEKYVTALSIIDQKTNPNTGTNANTAGTIRPTVICGLKIKSKPPTAVNSGSPIHTNEIEMTEESSDQTDINMDTTEKTCLFLVVYDFLFQKNEQRLDDNEETLPREDKEPAVMQEKEKNVDFIAMNGIDNLDDINFSPKYLIKHFSSFYKAFIPGESDEICLPPSELEPKKWFDKKWPESRVISSSSSEADSCSPVPCLNQDNLLLNGQISNVTEITQEMKSISDHINELKSKKLSKKLNYSRAVQCFILPSLYKNRSDLIISDIFTTIDGNHIVIVLKSTNEQGGVLLLYKLDFSNNMVTANPTPVHSRELSPSENPVQVTLLPFLEKLGKSKGIEGDLVTVCSDGAVRIIELATMKTISYAKLEGEKFTSAAYCNSLERLCVSTQKGALHFYVLNDTEYESVDDHEDEEMPSGLEAATSSQSCTHSQGEGNDLCCFHEPSTVINSLDLKRLYSLTHFEPLKAGYCAVVPPCWTEIQQTQRQRRHPQSLSVDGEAYTKTWRLQTDLTTWDEHIFEISLPSPTILGHVDVHFTLQPSTTSPHVEVTLLKQNSNGIGHKKDVTFSVDESITIGMLQWADNPVTSQEYLRSHNADILAGPVNIASCLDLTEQSGVVTLTSPKLFKSRNRTLLLHLRVVYSKEEECNRQNKTSKKPDLNEEECLTSQRKSSEAYMGCDCIHELSITVYAPKQNELTFLNASDRTERSLMLESTTFASSLISTFLCDPSPSIQNFVLDILNWIASIRLTRNRSNYGAAPHHQIEFISLMENQLQNIISQCFLSGGRSLAHRCAKLITTCSRGAKNISDKRGEIFNTTIMNYLLSLMDSIGCVKSAGSLQWFFNILLAVTPKSENKLVATTCKNFLVEISDELLKKINPYHLLLRTRYGLYGTPMEPEMFDIEPPPYPKGSSVSITYASVVSGETSIASSDFYSTYSFYKEIINPKEVMSTSDNIMKCKNVSSSKLFKGLIETEPLNFICVSASEGTRLDKADESNSVMSNIVVNNVPLASYADLQSGTHKKDDIQLFWNNVIDMMNDVKNFKGGSQTLSEKFISHLKNPLNAFIADELGIDSNPLQAFTDGFRGNKTTNKPTNQKNIWQMEDVLSPEFQVNNMWQHLLVGSPQQVIVVERMHSGARRFVILDFGQPVMLTDLLIPACNDLVSVSIDVWLKSEDVDPTRIAVSFDISNRNLVLNDLLPPPICRFIKITVVGRYGMSTTRCRIPIGFFYGHMVIKSKELSNELSFSIKSSGTVETEKHLANLSKLFEDISCRYSISCSKLKDTLQGFLVADVKNASHLLTYMNTMKEKNSNVSSLEHNKVFQAYREAIIYQRQLNTVRHIMNRLEERVNYREFEYEKDLSSISSEKLSAIAEGLLEVLLSIDFVNELDVDTCQKLFHGFCVTQSPRLQFLAATYLKNTSAKCDFWGNFLADILSQMFSSSYTQTFPQDRVFTLIAYLSKLSPHRSSVLDAALRVTHECLKELQGSRKPLLAVSVDLPLLSWLLMYLSLQLDMNKNSNKSVTRWDWVFGEMLGKATVENSKSRLHKKALKKQISAIDPSVNKMPLMHMNKVSNPLQNVVAGKNGQEFFMKMMQYQIPENEFINKKHKEKKAPPVQEEKSSPKKNPIIYVDESHIRVVATGLINLILSMDHSSSADMLLLSFKVVARLSHLTKSSQFVKLRLGHLMNDAQLLNLVNFCLQSKIPWATHALACLLEDFLDWTPTRTQIEVEGDSSSGPSTSWEPPVEVNLPVDIFQDPAIISASIVINNKNKQLPSVYESDSSEIEELVEEVFGKEQNRTKKRSGKSVMSASSCLSSCAIDSRLDLGVETLSEINLRKLLHQNNQTLVQKISLNYINQEQHKKSIPWNTTIEESFPRTPLSNHKMLMLCFQYLFEGLYQQPPECIEQILQLWLTLNCPVKGDKFDRSKVPSITLTQESVNTLISVLVHSPGLSLVTWCISLQILTLVCNTPGRGVSSVFPSTIPNNAMADKIVEHPEFMQLLLRLLSEDWVMYSEKGLAGPALCIALYDLLIVLQTSFDVTSNYSEVCTGFKNLLLKTLHHLIQPSGPISCRQGPLDAQCKLIQSMLILNFENADLDIAMAILQSTADLVHSYVTNTDRIRCYYSGESTSSAFKQLYSTVLGSDAVKQERPVSYEFLLITLLKLSAKLVKTRIIQGTDGDEPMDTEPIISSQTDESKAEQIQQNSGRNTPCLADRVLQNHACVIKLCTSLSACKSSSICMLACISQKSTIISNFSEPNSLADGVFYVLISLAKCASEKESLMQPLLLFLSQTPKLSEPLIWFILQILENEETIRCFFEAGGLSILSLNFVKNINAPNTILKIGTISTVMQFFNKTKSVECGPSAGSSKKPALDEHLENRLSLINFAPCSTIKCSSSTAQPADILIQGNTTTHRRARTPQWSYHFYPDEVYTELVLTLPSAILLKQVHLQPHSIALSTCPSAIGLEISATGTSRLVPVCPPVTTSGMAYIQLDLPSPEVVKVILIRLYKPKMANNISLSQIRLLGFTSFNEKLSTVVAENDQHYKQSLGWIRLLYNCFSVPTNKTLIKNMVACCANIPDLLTSTCSLLLVPSHIMPEYLPCLEKVVRELSLHNMECSLITLKTLLESKCSSAGLLNSADNVWQDHLLVNNNGYQSTCELLYQICEYQDENTPARISTILEWVQSVASNAFATGVISECNPAYFSYVASILWHANANPTTLNYDLKSMITLELFDCVVRLESFFEHNLSLKYSLDSLLCSICYIQPDYYPILLRHFGILIPNLSNDYGSSVSDDRKGTNSMTDDNKNSFVRENAGWYNHLVVGKLAQLEISNGQLETVALVSRSPTSVQQLLDSGLPKILISAIHEFCTSNHQSGEGKEIPMAKLEKISAILKFFTEVSEEKLVRDWLGSEEGSSFWLPLLQWLCRKTSFRKCNLETETNVQLEEMYIKFLSKCCLCHMPNQDRLARVLCEVISQQTGVITGFMRRLVLQLLLENEKVPVNITADETLYKSIKTSHVFFPTHPAFKQTYKRALLHLSTTTTLLDILEEHIYFNPHKMESSAMKKEALVTKELKDLFSEESDLSVAAGVLAKDKRAKDNKNLLLTSTPVKKKRYTEHPGDEFLEWRRVKCLDYSDKSLPLYLTLGQLLKMIESKGLTSDWPCIHLNISHNKDSNDKIAVNNGVDNENSGTDFSIKQQSYSSSLQVFSAMGGLALLAQHLPTVYSETIRSAPSQKVTNDQSDSDWIKVEDCEDMYEEEIERPAALKSSGMVLIMPPYSLTAFGLFLRLPGYAEILLKDMKEALCLLRLVLGVTDDDEGNDIFQSPLAPSLPTLPFEVLRKLFDATKLSTDDGQLLRKMSISSGVVHLILVCLGIFTHMTPVEDKENGQEAVSKEERSQLYWAKGTGYGTGSTQQSWNMEQALLKQKSEEEHVTILLQVLASYINPNGEAADELAGDVLPATFHDLLLNSCLLQVLSSYLRNDSVLDMARHIPLYKAVLLLLRAIAVSSQLLDLLLPQKSMGNQPSISSLLKNMKNCVDTYTSKLLNTKSTSKSKLGVKLEDVEQDEGLANLMPDIQDSATLVSQITSGLVDSDNENEGGMAIDNITYTSLEDQYLSIMKRLQFGSYEMIEDLPEGGIKFVVSHHFESNAKATSEQSHPARVKRIAQETVTLSSSLPLSYSSSVFVRYDTSRLDVMKVLITGPADTPYANGCFELDVFFPQDYPISPMMINLETTGHHSVRFNPNLYNDGKVCLSVLNTWHGRPEEKWNVQTSSFLQVLVSIQSLILVPEPYFNEPGYERSRGTPTGNQSSKEYNATICQATVRWAMLEQIMNPCPCFKDIILTHFYLKRFEIIEQVEGWVKDFESEAVEKKVTRASKRTSFYNIDQFKKVVQQLKDQLLKLKPPDSLKEECSSDETLDYNTAEKTEIENNELDNDIEMQKMVNDMCE